MDRLRLWRYKKLANKNNENVKEEKTIDDEDYNSCFQLKKNLKNSCKKLFSSNVKEEEGSMTVREDAVEEQKIIKKLREQQNYKQQQQAIENQRTLHKCLKRILRKSSKQHHQRLVEVQDEKISTNHDEYVVSGIYDVFGHSCTAALTTTVNNSTRNRHSNEVETMEDLSSNSWYQSGLLGKFSLEMLKHQAPGSFIIHKGSQKSLNFILSLRIEKEKHAKSKLIAHYLILHSKRGYRIKGAKKFFPTISSLVTHHSVMAESLPVTLRVERNLVVKDNDDFSSIEDLKIVFTDLE